MHRDKSTSGIVLLLLMGVLGVMGCQSYDRSAHFLLVNKTGIDIHYWVSCDSAVQHLEMKTENRLAAHDSIMPFLIFGSEGKGPDKNTWVNAINRADDSALHVFYFYMDLKNDPDLRDTMYRMVIKKGAYRVDSLEKLHWRIECN